MAPVIDAKAPRNSFASIAGALLDDCWTHNKYNLIYFQKKIKYLKFFKKIGL